MLSPLVGNRYSSLSEYIIHNDIAIGQEAWLGSMRGDVVVGGWFLKLVARDGSLIRGMGWGMDHGGQVVIYKH